MTQISNEMIDIEEPRALRQYLHDTGRIAPSETVILRNLPGGVSNRTILVLRPSGQAWVIKQALAKLRVKVEWFSPPERIEREAAGLRVLRDLAPAGTITPLVFEDPAQHLLAMEAVPQPHENWKQMLLGGRLTVDHFVQFGRLIGLVHAAARERADLAAAFNDRSAFESLRIEPYYAYTAEKVSEAAGFLHTLIDETRNHRSTLVHGDYSPKNILVQQDRLVLLDHEVIHFGDPAFDIGFALAHLLSKAHHVVRCRERFAEAAICFADTYRDSAGEPAVDADFEARVVRQALGCLLARVDGRSPLEYLTQAEHAHQRQAVLSLLPDPPLTVDELVQSFRQRLS